MFKGSIIKKCISLVMVIAVLMGLAAPASAAVAEKLSEGSSIGYVALGDAITAGLGLYQDDTKYYEIVADYLGTDYRQYSGKLWRAEELRYLLDDDYDGDGYTDSIKGLGADKKSGIVKDLVKNADVVSVQIGVNNFATYFVKQLMNYLDPKKEPYAYDFDQIVEELLDSQDKIAPEQLTGAVETVRKAVMEQLLAAAPDEGDIAIEFIEYAVEVATYSLLSYVTSFNGMVRAIYELNPDVELYVIGIYNPAAEEVLTYNLKGREIEIPIGDAIGAVIELANSYAQILAPRAYNYTYVDPGTPVKLIDKMANKYLPLEERIPVAVKNALLDASESTAVSLIQELFAEYGITKTYKEALEIAQEIVNCKTDELRDKYIRESVNGLIVEEVIKQFEKELKNYDNAYGEIKITTAEIKQLLDDLWNAETETARENVATVFVENLMKNAMVGHTIAGVYVDDVEEAQELIDMLKDLAEDTTSPAEKRKAAAIAIAEKINAELANKGLGAWTVEAAQVLTLLERLDATEDNPDTAVDERLAIVESWLNDLAVDIIADILKSSNDTNVKDTLYGMFADMEKETDVAKREQIASERLTEIVAYKVKNSYKNNGLGDKPATEDSFEKLVTKALNGQIQIRDELRAAAVRKVTSQDFYKYVSGSITEAALNDLFNAVEVPGADISACVKQWIKDYNLTNLDEGLGGFVYNSFYDACTAYVKAAKDTEEAFTEYSEALIQAPKTCAQYVALKSAVAAEILTAYKTSYVGIADVAQGYYTGFMNLRSQAVSKVMKGYDQYAAAVEKGMASCDALTEKFDKVFEKLAKIAEVENICLNDLLDVAKKTVINGAGYVEDMIGNLMQGDSMLNSDMTVAYLALAYYFADGMMHLPSEEGHAIVAAQMIKAINGEPTNSTAGWLANLIIDKMIDIYHMPASASGQAKTLGNPDSYAAFGDNITLGSGTAVTADETYAKLLADALAMHKCTDEHCDHDAFLNLSLGGMRTEELLAIVDGSYTGDAYTDRFDIASLRDQYLAQVGKLDLVTINVGINNLVTYPLTQTLLAYNGETPYEMDWARYMGENWANKLNKGKNAVMDLLNHIVHNDSTCEKTLNTVATAVEAIAYSLLGYVVNLDCAVEEIYDANPDATIVLTEFYNPLLDTYFTTPGTITLKNVLTGGEKTVELKQYNIDVSLIADSLVNLANRFLTGYIGYYSDGVVARGENSRIVTVPINETPLDIDPSISKDLADLVYVTTINVMGRDITIKVPAYLKEAVATGGVALHPNAEGHKYIFEQILKTLQYEIDASIIVDDYTKYYGVKDPAFKAYVDDLSSLYGITVKSIVPVYPDGVDQFTAKPGNYDLLVTYTAEDGYKSVTVKMCDIGHINDLREDNLNPQLQIVKMPLKVTVTLDQASVVAESALPAYTITVEDAYGVRNDIDVDIDFSAVDINNPGTYTVSSIANVDLDCYDVTYVDAELTVTEKPVTGTITKLGCTLSLVGEVHINAYFKVSGFDGIDITNNSGLLVWNSSVDEVNAVFGTQDFHNANLNFDGSRYSQQTEGFAAKEYADEIYIRAYVRVGENEYVYSELFEFSVQDYCDSIVEKYADKASHQLRDTCIALLHYGQAAQVYFNYNTMDYANANIVDRFPAAEADWDPAYMNSLWDFETDIVKSDLVEHPGKTLSLDAATKINYYYTFNGTAVKSELLVWDGVTEKLTTANVSYRVDFDYNTANGRYSAQSKYFAADYYGKTIYACAHFVDENGVDHYSEVVAFSPEEYANVVISRNNNPKLVEAVKRMVIYGEEARIYFGKFEN